MGASNSSMVDEDKALQLCRERNKLIGQALDGRCSLAATHISYIEALKITGAVLRAFVELAVPVEPSVASNSATPELHVRNKMYASQTQQSPTSFPYANGNVSPIPSPPSTRTYMANHMKFGGTFSRKVEVKPSTPPTTPERMELKKVSKFADELKQSTDEEGTSELEGDEEKFSSPGRDESQASDEFEEPVTPTLVRSFENVNRTHENAYVMTSKQSIASEAVLLEEEVIG